MLMYPAVMVGGWYGGLRPALLATLLTTVARILLSSYPVGDLSSLGPSDWVQIMLYTTIATLISGLSEAMHRARRLAEEQTLRSQHHERELARSEERFRLAAQAVNCLIYDWDPVSGRAERTRGLFELTGFHPEEAVPDNDWWTSRIHPDDREQAIGTVDAVVHEGKHFGATYRVQHRDGHYLHVWDQGLILRDDEGRVTRVVGSTVDMSAQKAAEVEIRLAKEEAEAANSAKDHFIAVLSHELRTPLSPVLIMAQTLESTPGLDEEMRSGLEIIRRNAELEARLIDDLLDLTRISRGKLQLSIEDVDLHHLIGNAIEISREDITAREQQVVVELVAPNVAMKGIRPGFSRCSGT